MPSQTVSGDPDVLKRVSQSWLQIDDSTTRGTADVSHDLDRYHSGCDGPRIHDRSQEVANLAASWRGLTARLMNLAIQLDIADREDQSCSWPIDHTTGAAALFYLEDQMLNSFARDFAVLDTASDPQSKQDGLVSFQDLQLAALGDSEASITAQRLLSAPELLSHLDTGSSNVDYLDKVEWSRFHSAGGDGKLSRLDVGTYIQKRQVNSVLSAVSGWIDVAAKGGRRDGILSRADLAAFIDSGQATALEAMAAEIALDGGAVDGEQGISAHVADSADAVATYSGYAAAGLGVTSATLAATGVLAPAAVVTAGAAATLGTITTVASGVELIAGIDSGERDHVIGGTLGLATAGMAAGTGATIRGMTTPSSRALAGSADEILAGMLEGTPRSRLLATGAELAVSQVGSTAAKEIAGRAPARALSTEACRGTDSMRTRTPDG